MSSTYSTNLAIELMGTGDQAGTWGTTTNTNLGTLIEQAISGYVTQAVATGTDTTITIPNGASGTARNMFIELTGTGGASTNLIVPSNKKLYFVYNNTSSGQVTVKVSGQTGISVANGTKVILVSNGTDIVNATSYGTGNVASFSAGTTGFTPSTATTGAVTLAGTLATTNGGTGLTSFTANGVLYASSSSALTTGSALTFDGSTFKTTSSASYIGRFGDGSTASVNFQKDAIVFANDPVTAYATGNYDALNHVFKIQNTEQMRLTSTGLSIGYSAGVCKLFVYDASSVEARIQSAASAVAQLTIRNSDRSWSWANQSGGTLLLYDNTRGATVMAADSSGNVGIGTSSISSQVSGAYKVAQLQGASGGIGSYKVTDNGANVTAEFWASVAGLVGLSSTSNHPLLFSTNNTERMRLDTSGNLGLGVTPSAWGTAYFKAIQGASGSLQFQQNATGIALSLNEYINSSAQSIYIGADYATKYYQVSGQHRWYNAPSGTAGNPISFTQAMTLDASGNLGIGTTSPGAKLEVYGGASGTVTNVQVGNASTAFLFGVDGSNNCQLRTAQSVNMLFYTAGSERARIDSSGNLIVGGTSAVISGAGRGNITINGSSTAIMALSVGGSAAGSVYHTGSNLEIINYQSGGQLDFYVNGDYRARIASDGTFRVKGAGTFGSTDAVQFSGSAPASTLILDSSGNLGIGSSSPANKLYVAGGASTPVVAVTFSATAMTVNCQLSNTFSTTFTANVTTAPTISNPSDGQTINWFITQDGTGSRTMTWPTSFKWAGGTAGVLSTAANSVDLVVATYRSATGFWYVSLSKAFS